VNRLLVAALFVASPLTLAASDPQDVAGGKDPAMFGRMKGFHISNYEEKEFDRFEFPVAANKTEAVEGRHVYVDYYLNEGVKTPSALQVARNYTSAVKSIGGTVVYEFEDGGSQYATMKVMKGDAETWAFVEGAGNGMYKLHVVEKQAMRQDVTANAEAMASGLKGTGHIALYGIYFDTDKAELKPASEATIEEIAKLLEADTTLKLYVVGHTDNQGAFDHNLKLSQARAAAVVSALTKKHGIPASRLKPFGAGPTSPVASNDTDAGRAKNRRVELVGQ
jgi:outer membrane protein OmpA-like peptidoglycan-associated protein